MPMEYKINTKFEKLAPVLEDCAQWFGQVSLAVAYLNDGAQADKIITPISFRQWILEVTQDENYDEKSVSEISRVYNDMIDSGEDIKQELISKSKPSIEKFEEFQALYRGFINRLRGLEKGSLLTDTGICPETGFRSHEVIVSDQKKEMERLMRRGTTFSLVMVRIDDFGDLKNAETLSIAVESIKLCMRTIDDVYYLGEGHFLLSLKQTDIIGAEAATERLQILIGEKSNGVDISFSYCVAEPVEDDEVEKLIKNMREDLDEHGKERNISLKFLEQSPLQQYLKTIET